MSFFSFLKILSDIKRIILDLLFFFKKYPALFVFFSALIISTFGIIYFYQHDNSHYNQALRYKVVKGIIIDALDYKCKGDTGITIIAVAIRPQSTVNGASLPGIFEYAYVIEKGKITNKIDEFRYNNQYNSTIFIPVEYSSLLIRQAILGQPQSFNIQISDSIPDFIKKLLSISTWYRQGKMEFFYVDSLIKRDNLIYILTLSSASKDITCDFESIKGIFRDLKENL